MLCCDQRAISLPHAFTLLLIFFPGEDETEKGSLMEANKDLDQTQSPDPQMEALRLLDILNNKFDAQSDEVKFLRKSVRLMEDEIDPVTA